MRKDVRLGLALGGALFVMVISYVLFFTGPKAGKNEQANQNQNTGQPPAATATGGQLVDTGNSLPTASTSSHDSFATGATSTDTAHGAAASSADATSSGSLSINVGGPSSPLTGGLDASAGHTAATGTMDAGQLPGTDATGSNGSTTTADPAASAGGAPASGNWNWSTGLNTGTLPPSANHTESTGGAADASANAGTGLGLGTPVAGTDNVGGASADGAAARTPVQPRTYVVKPGETYWTIAKAEYGNGAYYNHLIRANPKISPNRLRANVTIVIPDKSEVVPPPLAARDAGNSGGGTGAAAAAPAAKPFDPATQYRVQPGDSLYRICQKLYGTSDKVEKLYQLNKDRIGPNRAALKTNMVLQLPDSTTLGTSATGLAGEPPAPALQ